MMPAKPPNTHPRPYLMPKGPTDLLNWFKRLTISGVQNVTLSLAQGLYKTLDPLFLFPIEPEISTTETSAFATERFGTY